MEFRRRKTAILIFDTLLAGALSACVCFAQNAPASGAAGKPAAQSASKSPAAAQATPANKVVLKVGNDQYTKADVDYLITTLSPQLREKVATQGRKPLGDEYATMVLLSQKAKSEHLDSEPAFQRRMALEKLQLLAQEEYRKLAENIQVTPAEVSTFYNAHKDDFAEAKVREFIVRKKAADAKAGTPGLSEADAKARLASIRKAVEAGTDIKDVAKKFDVPNVVVVSPKAQTVRKGQMIPALDQVAFSLKENQFSDPVDTPHAMVLLQVLGHQQQDLKEVSPEIENQLRQEKMKTAIDDMRAKANVWMDPDYFKAPLRMHTPGATSTQ